MTPAEITTSLGLANLKQRTWAIFKTSALKGEGLEDAMEWWVGRGAGECHGIGYHGRLEGAVE